MQKPQKNNKVKALALGGCAAMIAVGGTLAYLTATDSKVNEFKVADTLQEKIVLEEPNWNAENAQNMVPTQTVAKDPKLVNNSTVDVYAVMQVAVPYKSVSIADADGTVHPATGMDLFTYTVDSAWNEVGSGTLSEDGSKMIHTYLYGTPLAAGAETATIFDEVTLVNAIDNQIDGADLSIDVDGFAIQTEGFSSAAEAWAAYQKQNS
ncbi:MAG: SipW-dependent-type signal peptide-containing protein [Eggerthellaceae bacterium]